MTLFTDAGRDHIDAQAHEVFDVRRGRHRAGDAGRHARRGLALAEAGPPTRLAASPWQARHLRRHGRGIGRRNSMIIVTGAAGFIGSNLVRALNRRGITDILAVDDLTEGDKFVNLWTARSRTTWTRTTSAAACWTAACRTSARFCTRAPARTPSAHRSLHARQQLPRHAGAARVLPGARDPVHLRVLGGGVRRFVGVCRRSRQRRSAERLRLFQAAVRPGAAHPHGHTLKSQVGPALLQCLRSA